MALEEELERAIIPAQSALKASTDLRNATTALVKALTDGDLHARKKSIEGAKSACQVAARALDDCAETWPSSAAGEDALVETLAQEVGERLRSAGRTATVIGNDVWSLPAVATVINKAKAVRVNGRLSRSLRPTLVAKQMLLRGREQDPAMLLPAVRAAYLASASNDGDAVSVSEIYDLLTLLPGAKGSYTEIDFAIGLFALATSAQPTKDGSRLELVGSTGTKLGEGYVVLDNEGRTNRISAVRFNRLPE
ncbi:MAG: hypothetical protein JW395_2137 [Nitrospira sp.]|nr:hypothetical protein [Nitrospira sp.]